MKKQQLLFVGLALILIIQACSKGALDRSPEDSKADFSSTGLTDSSSGGGDSSQTQIPSGVLTAGEWHDLSHWEFWDSIQTFPDFLKFPDYWDFYLNHRLSVQVTDALGQPAVDVSVALKMDGIPVTSVRTDNHGRAELFAGLFDDINNPNAHTFILDVNQGQVFVTNPNFYKQGINQVSLPFTALAPSKIQVAFIVDATGSMGDEINYLKAELADVLQRVGNAHPSAALETGSVFYRDAGDDYLTRISTFSNNYYTTTNFVKNQEAGGGGDFPEAVHNALEEALNGLQWASNARTRILFLVLDAPPHHEQGVISSLQQSIIKAQEKGIKIIPIVASGIDKETEFLMRYFAVSTNGTYVFITDDSGIGNDHLEATVGPFQVEFLNDLMVRLVNFYAE